MKKRDFEQLPPSQSEIIDSYIERLEKKDKKYKSKKHRPSFTRRLRVVVSLLIVLLVALAGFLVVYLDVFNLNLLEKLKLNGNNNGEITEFNSSTLTEPDIETNGSEEDTPSAPKAERPSKLFAVTLTPGEDFSLSATEEELRTLADDIYKSGFTTIFLNINSSSGILTQGADGKAVFTSLSAVAKEKALAVYAVLDTAILSTEGLGSKEYLDDIFGGLDNLLALEGLDGIMLKGLEYEGSELDFKNYIATGTLSGFKDYRLNLLNSVVRSISKYARNKAPAKVLGLITDSVYATKENSPIGLEGEFETELLTDKNADVIYWMNQQFFDIVFVEANTTTNSKDLPFEKVVNWWSQNTPALCDVGFVLSAESALKGEGDWKNPDQLGRQLKILNEANRYVFCINSFSALKENTTGSSELVYKYLTGEVGEDYILRELSITSPQKTTFTTYENSVAIIGASDPNFPLLLNGKEAERTADGYFSLQLDLKVGNNQFIFEHKGTTKTLNITYRYVIIKSYTPASAIKQDGGSSILVTVLGRKGSKITATLNDKVFNLELAEEEQYSDFATYQGIVTLPAAKEKAYSVGKIKFKGVHNGVSETFYGGEVTINKRPVIISSTVESSSSIDSDLPPENSGGYIPVGNNLIAEVVKYQVETFDGDKINDLSQPYNNYLPKGTMDYCDENTIYDPSSGNTYRKLRYGKRVYTTSKGGANVTTKRGSLPNTNKLSVESFTTSGSHTVMTLKTDWKAPFKLTLSPQKYYSSTGSERGTISAATFNYIDITFCYASQFEGAFDDIANSPVFSRAQIIKNTSDYTLRLYLKKTGAFYGWSADYDSSGNLVFKFLNPKKATKADNKYGGRLDGITIVIDPGHGGSDPGAVGSVSTKELTEANRSLLLAKMLKENLESIGAKVIMTRTSDVSLTSDERILKVINNNPDLTVSVHRNAAWNTSASGFSAHYFNPYTKAIADELNKATAASGTYAKTKTAWHVFYMSRISNCPVVLTENGFMSNSTDFGNMKNNSWNSKCADAITKGIVEYFLNIG